MPRAASSKKPWSPRLPLMTLTTEGRSAPPSPEAPLSLPPLPSPLPSPLPPHAASVSAATSETTTMGSRLLMDVLLCTAVGLGVGPGGTRLDELALLGDGDRGDVRWCRVGA